MRKRMLLPALLLCLVLAACGGEKSFSGELTAVRRDESGVAIALTIRTEDGKDVKVLLDGETRLWGEQEELTPGNRVLVGCDRKVSGAPAGESGWLYLARDVDVTGILERGGGSLADGAALDILRSDSYTAYKLEDGTELLQVRGPTGPENVYVGDLESFDDLSEAAKGKVRTYYEEQGLLYDLDEELERAYAEYKEKGAEFRSHWIDQSTSPSASSQRVMYFLTTASIPVEGNVSREVRLNAAFDRETGEVIAFWDLFDCPEEEARRAILDRFGAEGTLREEMEAAFRPETVYVSPEGLTVYFASGELPSVEPDSGYIEYVKFGEGIEKYLQDWAIPRKAE